MSRESRSYKLLYLEDSQEDVELFTETLKQEYLPCEVTWVNGHQAFESALSGGWSYDLIFADFSLPDIHGDEALAMAKRQFPDVPFIFLSGIMGEEKAVECLRNGATDYVLKTNLTRLAPVIRRALEEARLSTARKEAEAATNRAVSLLRATLESTAEGILVVDLAGRISTYNRKFMSLCGIPDYVMAPMEMERVLQFLLDQFEDPNAFLAEARLLSAQPERESFGMLTFKGERKLEEYSRPHRIGNQTVGRVYTFHDVTAREKNQEQVVGLANAGQRLLEATAAGRVVPWCLSEDSLLLPESAAKLLALGAGELPADLPGLEALIHPKDLDPFREALEHPSRGSFNLRMRKGGNTWLWTRWTLARHPAGGYHGIFQDIHDERRAEEASADRRRSQGMAFLADHQGRALNRLLTEVVRPMVRLQASGPFHPDQEADLSACSQAVANIEAHLALVTLSQRCEPEPGEGLDLAKAMEDLQAALRTTLAPGIKLETDLGPGLPALPMSAAHWRQLLLSLVANANEALKGAGTIKVRVRARPAGPSSLNDADGVSVEVEDNGSGIPPEVQVRMFEPFFTTKPQAQGLGLPVARSIAEGHQGSIRVASSAGQGTTVSVVLPAHMAAAPIN